MRVPPVVYDPRLVADAILFAAEHPRRTLVIGGNGLMISLMGQVAPRLTDLVMEAIGRPAQIKPQDPGDPAKRDNLYEPRPDGVVDGSQDVYVRRQSLLLEAQKRPMATAAVLGAVGCLTWIALSSRRRPSALPGREDMARSSTYPAREVAPGDLVPQLRRGGAAAPAVPFAGRSGAIGLTRPNRLRPLGRSTQPALHQLRSTASTGGPSENPADSQVQVARFK